MFASVLATGHTEAKLKVKAFEQLLSEVVPLNHPEVLYGHVSYGELNTERGEGCGANGRKSGGERQFPWD